MGYVYYGNYAQYFEVARVEMLRELGIPYQQLEEEGTALPVRDLQVKYLAPAKYDDLLTIKTDLLECGNARIQFAYRVYGSKGKLLNEASTILVFVDKITGKPKRAPDSILRKLDLI